ncbi:MULTISPECIES: hypothetical protein [unclassified Streptomyces]|uniref:hypothetical protein n=1 Tax=unclassified Streptomyces TaxID=2593676 RepID=UPI000379D9D4|nr:MULTISPECIES: hypothetical protein [unclassified Streptomyces]MYQ79808.1 hypothetical protein [Streptomyces sp. SID4923]
MKAQTLFCYTCNSDEMHRPLTDDEKSWLRGETGRAKVDEFFMCEAPTCRNVRSGYVKRPFHPVIRIPVP